MRDWAAIYLKGFCMGAADMVPGVSGGTVALITGIYDRLIEAVASIEPRILLLALAAHRPGGRTRLNAAIRRLDLPFLLALGAGIATAVLVVSRLVLAAFEAQPAAVNAFFFGLIAASAIVIYRTVPEYTPRTIAVAVAGFLLAFVVSGLAGGGGAGGLPVVFVAGAIAISAMVLPGISGAAFLYILGQYEYLLGALRSFVDAVLALPQGGTAEAVVAPGVVVATFMAGAVIGLLTMARIVGWALSRYRVTTMTFLVSLMVGSLRLPIEAVAAETVRWTIAGVVVVAASVAVGVVAVLALDWYTDTLEYV